MKCCGKEITTAFCPDCGKPSGGDPITEIWAHIAWLLDLAEKAKLRAEKRAKKHKDATYQEQYRQEQRLAACDRKVAKFRRWLSCLESLTSEKPTGQATS